MKRFWFEKNGRSWKFSPPRFISFIFFILTFFGFVLKWAGLKYVESSDMAILMGSATLFLGVYELRRHSKSQVELYRNGDNDK